MQERILKMNFESTFKKYYRPLCLYAMHYLKGDIDDAEDVVQDCFVKLWQKHSDNTSCNIPSKSYLYTSVRNACIDLLRKQNPCVSVYDPTDLDGYITDEEAQERSVQEAYLWSLIDELPVRCREVTIAGKVYFDIRHDEARPFRIKGSGFVINDLGTKLQVSSSTDENNMTVTDVIVSEGEVSFSRDGNSARTVNVRAGQASHLNSGAEQPEIIVAASNKMTWATHKFHFNNAPLSEVLSDLSDYYEVSLHCNDMNHSLTADLNADSLDTIISIINETFDIDIQIQK